MDPGGAGELRRAEISTLLGVGAANLRPGSSRRPDDSRKQHRHCCDPDAAGRCGGHQHPAAYESSKLTAAERNHPAHILERLAVVHALRNFRHYLLGGGAAPWPEGCWSDFDLLPDNQAIEWLKTNRHLNKMYVRW